MKLGMIMRNAGGFEESVDLLVDERAGLALAGARVRDVERLAVVCVDLAVSRVA